MIPLIEALQWAALTGCAYAAIRAALALLALRR